MDPRSRRAARLALTLLLTVYGVACLRTPGEFRLVDFINLPIHETGHLLFAPFGEFMQALGGTLFQLIMPAAFVGYFLKRGDRHAASVALWWIGENCWNIAVYVADARAQELPLVGGGEHDWTYLLGEMGWLMRDAEVARAVHVAGVVIFALATVGGVLAALQEPPAGAADEAYRADEAHRADRPPLTHPAHG